MERAGSQKSELSLATLPGPSPPEPYRGTTLAHLARAGRKENRADPTEGTSRSRQWVTTTALHSAELVRIRGYDVVALAKKTWAEIGKDKISVYAAQMAYSFFFALFPLLLFFAALLNLVADKQTVMAQFNGRIAAALPGDVASLLGKTIEKVVFSKGAPGLLSFGLLTAAWSGSSIFGALRAALNAAYDVEETRPRWKQYGLQLGMLVLAGGITVLATLVLLNGEGIVGWLAAHLGLGRIGTLVWTIIQFPLAIAALVAVLWLIYFILPNCRHQDKRILIVAATVSTLLWIAATLLFRIQRAEPRLRRDRRDYGVADVDVLLVLRAACRR
jgi:YihY family inner membrane protein